MGNAKSGLGLSLVRIDLNDGAAVLEDLWDILSVDNDMTENEDYFQEDTLELGYPDEASRIVDEAAKGKQFNTIEGFEEVFNKVFAALSGQEYYCVCDYAIEDLGDGHIILAYAYGGNYSW
tara:strand:+ start:11438 stop:11800 length:363 start_codon:yes stop_codon:yes gene_type:complete